jgi:hypothetical protein
MNTMNLRNLAVLASSLTLLALTGCASTQHWTAAGGSKSEGIVRLSYEFPEFHEPALSEAQAEKLAESRCASWGYESAVEVPGQLRECANADGGNCDLWKVTREYQCRTSSSMAARLSR